MGFQLDPIDNWTFTFDGDYLNTRFYEVNTIPQANGLPSSAYVVGDPMDFIPKHTFTVSGQRDFSVAGKKGFVRLDYNQQGRETYRQRNQGPWFFSQSDIINMLNFNSTLQWSEQLSIRIFAQNLLNNRGFTDPQVITGAAARPRPRSIGFEFTVKLH